MHTIPHHKYDPGQPHSFDDFIDWGRNQSLRRFVICLTIAMLAGDVIAHKMQYFYCL